MALSAFMLRMSFLKYITTTLFSKLVYYGIVVIVVPTDRFVVCVCVCIYIYICVCVCVCY